MFNIFAIKQKAQDSGIWRAITSLTGSAAVPEKKALSVSAVWACSRILSETLASMPCYLYERLENGGKRKAVDDPNYLQLRYFPNNRQTAYQHRSTMMMHLALSGNAFALKVWEGGKLNLIPIHYNRVTVEADKENNEPLYIVDGNRETKKTADEIFHVWMFGSDGWQGLSPITTAYLGVSLALSVEEHADRYYKNGTFLKNILKLPGILKPEKKKELAESIARNYGGADKAGKTMILDDNMSYENVGVSARDAQMIEAMRWGVLDIARIYRVPPHMLADMSDANYSNVVQMNKAFLTQTMMPYIVAWEQAYLKALSLNPQKKFVSFDTDAYLRGDLLDRYNAHSIAINTGFMNRNEVRQIENLNPVPGLDSFLTPLNMADGGQVAAFAEDVARRITASEKYGVIAANGDIEKLENFWQKHASYIDTALQCFKDSDGVSLAKEIAMNRDLNIEQKFEKIKGALCN